MKKFISFHGVGGLARKALGVRLGRLHQYPPRPLSLAALDDAGKDDGLPAISIVTPSFNQVHFVQDTVKSVLGQAYAKLHYVVQDANSSDGTQKILAHYAGQGVDVHIEADKGQTDGLNRGFARTSGEVMAYLNSDDIFLPGTLHLVGRYFRDNPKVDVIYGNRLLIDEAGQEVGRWIVPRHDAGVLRFIDYVPQETMFWRRRIWERLGTGFDADLHFAMDWDLILRFLAIGAVFDHVPALVGVFRVHGQQKTQANYLENGRDEISILRQRYNVPGLSRVGRLALHWNFLSQHKRADKAFAASIAEKKMEQK